MNTIAKQIDRVAKRIDDRIGLDAVFTSVTYGETDVTTGQQSRTEQSYRVKVHSWPISAREQLAFAQAGLTQLETRWAMRKRTRRNQSIDAVNGGDVLTVGGLQYEVLREPVADLDDLGIEWTIYTRRIRAV